MDKLYASLKELAGERRERLQEHLRLCQLRRELDDLEQWIQEREVVAASHELGQDYEHVTVSACRLAQKGSRPAGRPKCWPRQSDEGGDKEPAEVGFELSSAQLLSSYAERGAQGCL